MVREIQTYRRRRMVLPDDDDDFVDGAPPSTTGRDETPAPAPALAPAAAREENDEWAWKRPNFMAIKPKINLYSRLSILDDLEIELQKCGDFVYEEFRKSCFGFVLRMDNRAVSCNAALHAVIAKEVVKKGARDEFWFRIGNRLIRFSKYEYALITGLSFAPTTFNPNTNHVPPPNGLYDRYYRGVKVSMDDLLLHFAGGAFRDDPSDELKVAKLLVAYYLLFAWDPRSTVIEDSWWTLVDHVDQWESFCWGKYSFQILCHYLSLLPTEPKSTFRIYGFVWAFLIWAYEAIPNLGDSCGVPHSDIAIPRCTRWKFPKSSVNLHGFLDRQIDTHRTLTARDNELPYLLHVNLELRSGVVYVHRGNPIGKKKPTTPITPQASKRRRTTDESTSLMDDDDRLDADPHIEMGDYDRPAPEGVVPDVPPHTSTPSIAADRALLEELVRQKVEAIVPTLVERAVEALVPRLVRREVEALVPDLFRTGMQQEVSAAVRQEVPPSVQQIVPDLVQKHVSDMVPPIVQKEVKRLVYPAIQRTVSAQSSSPPTVVGQQITPPQVVGQQTTPPPLVPQGATPPPLVPQGATPPPLVPQGATTPPLVPQGATTPPLVPQGATMDLSPPAVRTPTGIGASAQGSPPTSGGDDMSIRVVRARVKSRYLRSPFTAHERRKEDATHAEYMRFLASDESRNVGYALCTFGSSFFKDIESPTTDLDSVQIDAYLSVLHCKPELAGVVVHPQVRGRMGLVDTQFALDLVKVWTDLHGKNPPDMEFDGTVPEVIPADLLAPLVEYVHGERPLWGGVRPWSSLDHVVFIHNLNNHWIVVRIALKENKIWIYDSNIHKLPLEVSLDRRAALYPFARIIPVLLRQTGFYQERPELTPRENCWIVKIVGPTKNYEQHDSHSCGPFALRRVESFLINVFDPALNTEEYIRTVYRRHLAFTVYKFSTDASTWTPP